MNVRKKEIMDKKEAIKMFIEMAKKEKQICYLYFYNFPMGVFGACFEYWDDWLFKAYPGGRTELSVKGKEILGKEQAEPIQE